MHTFTFIAKGIIAKDIKVKSLSGEPVTVICDPAEVRSCFRFRRWQLGSLRVSQCADDIRVETEFRSRPTWGLNAGMAFSCQRRLEKEREVG